MTIREAALTDCLSTRWRHLWKKVKNVILDKHNFGMQTIANPNIHENSDLLNSEATEFVHKVNRVLHHHSGNGIEKFEVKFPLSSTHASDLDRWIAFAAASSAEKIFISLHDKHDIGAPQQSEPYKFPLKEFADMRDYCRLRVLFLSMCSLETVPTNLSGFSHLESLSLNCVSIVDEVFLNIASSCHALHELWLKKCNQLIHVRISNSQLVAMEVNGCKSLISINVHAKKLEEFSYMGHKVDIEYECAPVLSELNVHFVKRNECPLDCIGTLPALQTLTMQFPSRLQESHVLHHNGRFTGLKEMVLCLMKSWGKSIISVVYLLKAAPLVETLTLEVYDNIRPLRPLNIIWPEDFTAEALHTIWIGGFSGEPELVDLLFFLLGRSPVLKTLLVYTQRRRYQGYNRWQRYRWTPEDMKRRYYARGVAFTLLAPKVPPTVKLTIS
ncbi:unnamed protein product [Urochloa decumbens]|uniref:At1g61320/AtMIF1 LRR domain-containing protein n=1 Tax=Urochloa decumbens TaxID=240449 RepID=A0ABC9GE02_9POAL